MSEEAEQQSPQPTPKAHRKQIRKEARERASGKALNRFAAPDPSETAKRMQEQETLPKAQRLLCNSVFSQLTTSPKCLIRVNYITSNPTFQDGCYPKRKAPIARCCGRSKDVKSKPAQADSISLNETRFVLPL